MGGQFLRSCLVKGGGWCTLEQRCVEDDVAHCPAVPLAGSGGTWFSCRKCWLLGGLKSFLKIIDFRVIVLMLFYVLFM